MAALIATLASPAHAALYCVFDTDAGPTGYAFEGMQENDDNTGTYALLGVLHGADAKALGAVERFPEGSRPAWLFQVRYKQWELTSIDNPDWTINSLATPENIAAGGNRFAWNAVMFGRDHAKISGVCSIGARY
jgi:hypothetical protein